MLGLDKAESERKAMQLFSLLMGCMLSCLVMTAHAAVPKDLAYPQGSVNAMEVARQVYFVNHFYAVSNLIVDGEAKHNTAGLLQRAKGKGISRDYFQRFLNNVYSDGEIKARDMVLFRFGRLAGSGILVTDYASEYRAQSYALWLPSTARLRVFPAPDQDAAWGNSDLTFGDVTLRKPQHEVHELLEDTVLKGCLGAMTPNDQARRKIPPSLLPEAACQHRGKAVYQLKSTTKFADWWYDYRISLVDQLSFADYRTDYFKDGQLIKRIDRDWLDMPDQTDPRAQFWRYWYAVNRITGHETQVSIPTGQVKWNQAIDSDFWSKETLKKARE
jgi:hypothetical protein